MLYYNEFSITLANKIKIVLELRKKEDEIWI